MSESAEPKPRIQVQEHDSDALEPHILKHEKLATTHLDFVLSFLVSRWIPALPANLHQFESLLSESLSESHRSSLRTAIGRDPAIVSHLLKDLLFATGDANAFNFPLPTQWKSSPLILIDELPVPQLKPFLLATLKKLKGISTGDLRSKVVRALCRPLVCAIVAESLAPALQVDERIAYFSALSRNLGDSLLSWNYPNMYSRAWSEAHTVSGVHAVLRQGLGFTPHDLVRRLFKQWKIDESLLKIVEDPGPGGRSAKQPMTPLEHCLDLAEVFCLASDPTQANDTSDDWLAKGPEIIRILGNSNYRHLCFHLETCLSEHIRITPRAFQVPKPPGFVPGTFSRASVSSAPTGPVHPEVRVFFERHEAVKLSVALQELFQKVLPKLGFETGVLVDPTEEVCLILFNFGALTAASLEQIEHPVQRIKKTSLPISEEGSATVGPGRGLAAIRVQSSGPVYAFYLEYNLLTFPGGTRAALGHLNTLKEWMEQKLKNESLRVVK